MGIIVAVIFIVGFIILLAFVPADKLLSGRTNKKHVDESHKKFENDLLFPDYIHDPKYSRMSGNIYHTD